MKAYGPSGLYPGLPTRDGDLDFRLPPSYQECSRMGRQEEVNAAGPETSCAMATSMATAPVIDTVGSLRERPMDIGERLESGKNQVS